MTCNYKHLPICQININGLSAQVETTLEHFIHKRSIGVLALQEVRKNEVRQDLFPGMTTFSQPCGQGVSISVANIFYPQHLPALSDQNLSIVYALTTIGGSPAVVASAYCSPNPPSDCSALKLLLENILNAWKYCQKNSIENFIVLGDFNARNRMWGDKLDNPRGRILKEFIHKWDCEVSAPMANTFITRTGGSVIDLRLSFGRSKQHLCPPWIDTSDLHELFTGAPERGHIPVISHYKYNSSSQGKVCNTVFNYDDADWPQWSKYLDSILSSKLLEIDNGSTTHTPGELYTFFLESVNDSSNRYIPQKRVCSHSKPYWSATLSTLSDKLRAAQKTYLGNSTLSNKETYNTCRDEFKAALLKEKNEWIHTKLEKLNARDCKIFWKTYSRQFLSQDENFISNLCCPDTNKMAHSDADKEKLLFETFFSGI
jgi:hypothetical protein